MLSFGVDPTHDVAHRPWPLPKGPWIMGQRWNDLLFMHWPVQLAAMRALVPPKLELDLYQGTAWVSITPFCLSHMRPRGLPALPVVSEFLELNLRTYVVTHGKPGVYFFSLDASSSLAVFGARTFFHLPYFTATMSQRSSSDGTIAYSSSRRGAEGPVASFSGSYAPTGPVTLSEAGSLDYWLTERYCLYADDSAGRIHRTEIHHRRWPLQPARCAITVNTIAQSKGTALPDIPPRTSYSRMLDVVVWPPELVP